MPMRVLVVGDPDFIGRQVVELLAGSGWAAPIQAVRAADVNRVAGVERRPMNLMDRRSIAAALTGVDAVVDCSMDAPDRLRAGCRNLFAAAASSGLPRIVQLSSMAVYGDNAGVLNEEQAVATGNSAYAQARIEGEQVARAYPKAVVLRPGVDFGPHGKLWSTRVARWLYQCRLGDLGAAGDGVCNLVYVDDVARAVTRCLQLPEVDGSVFNLAMSSPPTWNEFLIRFAKALGAVPVRRITARRLKIETKLLAPPMKVLEIGLRRIGLAGMRTPEPIPPSLLASMRQEIRLDSTRAQKVLGIDWTPLDVALERTAAWVRAAN